MSRTPTMKEKSNHFDVDFAAEFADCDSTPVAFVDEYEEAIKDHEVCKDVVNEVVISMIGTLVETEAQDWIKLYKEGVISAQKLREKLNEFKELSFVERQKLFRQI